MGRVHVAYGTVQYLAVVNDSVSLRVSLNSGVYCPTRTLLASWGHVSFFFFKFWGCDVLRLRTEILPNDQFCLRSFGRLRDTAKEKIAWRSTVVCATNIIHCGIWWRRVLRAVTKRKATLSFSYSLLTEGWDFAVLSAPIVGAGCWY
jgi:hypothetical protein